MANNPGNHSANNPYELTHLPASRRNQLGRNQQGRILHESNPVRSARQIVSIAPGSIAEELGLKPGDELLEVNGKKIKDVFDYRLAVLDDELTMLFRTSEGEFFEAQIEKDEDEDLGLEFAEAMMDDPTHCHNKCLFCFIDQLPPGMRETLYFKDDDMRLSFLSGNYITLTNIKDEELDRLIAYHLSPMNISVHTTNPELRKSMLCNRFASDIMAKMQRIAAAGIEINVQIVLVPDVNDGAELERTLDDLATLGDSLESVAIVPVGLTKYREELKLPLIKPVGPVEAAELLALAKAKQSHFLGTLGRRVVYPADEFYLLAGEEIPEAEAYEGFPQLENGIGLLSLFRDEMEAILAEPCPVPQQVQAPPTDRSQAPQTQAPTQETVIHVPVGTAAADFMRPYCETLGARFGVQLELHAIENHFFGEKITVSGLLTGQDVLEQLREPVARSLAKEKNTYVFIGDVMLRQGTEVFLDDRTVTELEKSLEVPVRVVGANAAGLQSGLQAGYQTGFETGYQTGFQTGLEARDQTGLDTEQHTGLEERLS